MNSEFTIIRVKKSLSSFCSELEKIMGEFEDATYERKEELMVAVEKIRKKIEDEENRINKSNTTVSGVESEIYFPALKEAHVHLEQALDKESNEKVYSCPELCSSCTKARLR